MKFRIFDDILSGKGGEGIAYAVGRAIEENSIYRNVNIITNYWETNERKVLNLLSN